MEECFIVEEQLRNEVCCTGIDFLLQVGNIFFQRSGFGVAFRIASSSNVEIRVLFPNVGNQVTGVGKVVFRF